MNLEQTKETLKKTFPDLIEWFRKLRAKKWEEGSIVFYVGDRKEPLAHDSLKEGISGSYTAVVYLSKEWVKLGYKVTIYSPCEGKEGVYEGVEYKNYYYFNPYDTFDVLIVLQHPYLLKLPVKARKVFLEWQDVLGNEKVYPREKLARFDKIFAKSQFQRQLMPFMPDDKFVIVTNGVDRNISRFSSSAKDPYKLIYASRYYRGLEFMLTYGWPIIKREIPEAELHIYYGWTRRDNVPQLESWRQRMEELMGQEGVFEHGKIGQDKLILEKSTASIHYYACTYKEIDCISVRESALVGCVPVTTDCFVFAEKDYCVKVPGDPMAKDTQEAVAYKIVDLLRNPQELESIRQHFLEAAKTETWDNIAKVWVQNFS